MTNEDNFPNQLLSFRNSLKLFGYIYIFYQTNFFHNGHVNKSSVKLSFPELLWFILKKKKKEVCSYQIPILSDNVCDRDTKYYIIDIER